MKLLSILLVIILVGCSSPPQPKLEYKKITPNEAMAMIDENNAIVILDVRTQEEFEKGHIKNAVLIPDYEVKDTAEMTLYDKSEIILVYCRTGRRSESASKELISMGYTNVFDFGGIVDWTGAIVWDDSDTGFYNYFGGELPPDIVTPIDYTLKNKINEQFAEFTFAIRGINTRHYGLNHDKSMYYVQNDMDEVSSIVIKSDDEKYNQELTFERTYIPNIPDMTHGFSLDDWNFDGCLDISLWTSTGGTSLNSPHYYWLWDTVKGIYVRSEELERINDGTYLEIDAENKQLISATRLTGGYYHGYYELKSGQYILVKTDDLEFVDIDYDTGKARGHHTIKELINGKMVVATDYFNDDTE